MSDPTRSPARDAVLAAVRALWAEHQRGVTRPEVRAQVSRDGREMSDRTVRWHLNRLAERDQVRPPPPGARTGWTPSLAYCLEKTG